MPLGWRKNTVLNSWWNTTQCLYIYGLCTCTHIWGQKENIQITGTSLNCVSLTDWDIQKFI